MATREYGNIEKLSIKEKSECERQGKVWVRGHYRGNNWVYSYCRDRTYEEINKMSSEEKKKFEKLSPDLSGQWEGNGSEPLDAVNEILLNMNLPYNGGGEEFDFENSNGNNISDEEWEKNGGNFSTTIYKNGRYYMLSGTVFNKNGKWIAGAETTEVEFD